MDEVDWEQIRLHKWPLAPNKHQLKAMLQAVQASVILGGALTEGEAHDLMNAIISEIEKLEQSSS
jgi:hypothetical protein